MQSQHRKGNMNTLKKHYLVKFSRKSGKIDITMEALGNATLKLWALQNTSKGKDTIIFEKETGKIIAYFEGNGDFPKEVEIDENENIEDYCKGLLAELNKEEE